MQSILANVGGSGVRQCRRGGHEPTAPLTASTIKLVISIVVCVLVFLAYSSSLPLKDYCGASCRAGKEWLNENRT
jgi:hypothetical protein